MSVVLQKRSHHLVLGFSPPNNCKTKSSPTPAYFSPTPVGSFWQIICEIFHYVHRLIKLWPLRLHDSLCFLVTGLSMFPLWCHLGTFKKRTCRPTTHLKGWWSAAWWTTAPCGKVNPAISGVDSELIQVLTYLNETDHLLKGDMGVGGGTLIAVKGLWHRHTQRKDRQWWIVVGKSLLHRSFKGKNLQSSSRQILRALREDSLSPSGETKGKRRHWKVIQTLY